MMGDFKNICKIFFEDEEIFFMANFKLFNSKSINLNEGSRFSLSKRENVFNLAAERLLLPGGLVGSLNPKR